MHHQQPLNMIVEVTSKCNLSCYMCGVPQMTRRKMLMDFDLFMKIVDEAAEKNYRLTWLHHMGEPLLYPSLCNAIKYQIKKCGYPPCISTNGLLLDKDMCSKLKEAGLYSIMVCLSSMRKDVYDKLRVGGDMATVIKNIHLAYDAGLDVIIQKMKTSYNHNETDAAYRLEFGADKPRLTLAHWPVNKFKPGGKYIGYNESLKPTCHLLASHFVVCANGRVAVCCFDYNCTTPCGDLNIQTIEEVAEHGFDKYVEKIKARDLDDMPACKECLSTEWREKFAPNRFEPVWAECI